MNNTLNNKEATMKATKKYYSVGIGKNTDMHYNASPDQTCGHRHRSYKTAVACQQKLLGYHKEHGKTVCSAKWYNSYIVMSADTDSGWI